MEHDLLLCFFPTSISLLKRVAQTFENYPGNKQIQLGTKIISKEHGIPSVSKTCEELVVGSHIEVYNPLRGCLNYLRVFVHLMK